MVLNVEQLNWKRVDDGFEDIEGGFDDGTFYGLEEIDDVDVVKDNNTVKFVPKSEKPAKKPEKKKDTTKAKKTKPAAKKSQGKSSASDSSTSTTKKDEEDDDEEVADDNVFGALAQVKDTEPVYSLSTWPKGLDWRIYTGLKALGFTSPTPIQAESIPPILENQDVIGKAATGSGKTLAYSIPLLQRFYTDPEAVATRPEGLIVSPTRELAHQIRDHLKALVPPEDKPRIVALTGGLAIQKQLRLLSKSPVIVVATPGRLLEIMEQMPSKKQSNWQKIPSLVLDEADRLVQSGSFAELESTLKIIGISNQRQILVYSATFNTELWSSLSQNAKKRKRGGDIRDIMQQKLGLSSTAQFVDADPDSQVAESILQATIECPNMEKDLYLYYFLLLYPGKSAVFVNSIDAVKRIVPLLKEVGIAAIGVHSDMAQKQRLRSIERFKETSNATLIATDVAARGLDVPFVDHVVHYHLPRTGDMYVHRSGRTARAGNMGVAVTLCSPQEASGPLPNLVKLIGTKLAHIDIDYDVLEKLRDRVRLAKKIADAQSAATKKGKSEAWLTDAAEELGIDLDDSFSAGLAGDLNRGRKESGGANTGEGASTLALKNMRAELAHLLNQKLGANRRYLTSGTQNLASAMLRKPDSVVPGKPMQSALDELKSKLKKKTSKPQPISTADNTIVQLKPDNKRRSFASQKPKAKKSKTQK